MRERQNANLGLDNMCVVSVLAQAELALNRRRENSIWSGSPWNYKGFFSRAVQPDLARQQCLSHSTLKRRVLVPYLALRMLKGTPIGESAATQERQEMTGVCAHLISAAPGPVSVGGLEADTSQVDAEDSRH